MNEIIPITNVTGELRVDSRVIANELGIQHKNLLETINKHRETIEFTFGPLAFETDSEYEQVSGISRRRCAHLTEGQALFVATLSRNTEQVVTFKSRLVTSFQEVRQQFDLHRLDLPKSFGEALMLAAKKQMELEQANQEIKQLEIVVVQQAKKVAYVDQVLTADNCWTTTTIAKELGMSAITLNKRLHELGVQFFRDGHWILYHQYQNKGYTKSNTHLYENSQGKPATAINTVWTELGRAFITKKVGGLKTTPSTSFNQPTLS